MKLTDENLKKLVRHSNILMTIHKVLVPVIGGTVMIIQFMAFHGTVLKIMNSGYSTLSTTLLVIYTLIHVLHMFPWLYYFLPTMNMTIISFYLSATYITMRFNQLNDEKERLLNARTNTESEARLQKFITEFREIVNTLNNCNQCIKWILFCVVYIFTFVSYFTF